MVRMSPEAFEELVAEALDAIPDPFGAHLDNVNVVVEARPSPEELQDAGVEPGGTLFGLYHGIPQTERDAWYTFVAPDHITIYREPILDACRDADEVFEEVQITVVHEIAHHFGISDERLEELGWD